jgi:hypothetical protein
MTNIRLFLMHGFIFLGVGVAAVSAQSTSSELTPPVQQRVEALLRSKVELPTATTLSFKMGAASELPGFNKVSVHFASASQELAGISLF